MGNKLKQYIKNLRAFLEREEEIKDVEAFKQELFREIQFWQHERLIHLLVTMLFALLTMSVLLVMVFQASIALLVLFFMLLVLLVPYIRHYYILENGVQTLYVIYEEVCRRNSTEAVPGACIPEEYGIKIKPFSCENKK
ncbi:MAG: hypothetical protein IJ192_00145 [Clostridia bacterium]|nr:hypothetical protein [Clostridia bacterium]MBR2176346.1 hypothetical protein [Clostridia bacterium]